MADQYVQVAPDSTGKKIDNSELVVGANTVERQRIVVSGAAATELADVKNAAPTTEFGLVTRNIPSGTQAVSAASLPLPTGAATSALQTQPGVDIGDVTVNNAAGASAVNVQDGGNSITVDGTVTVGTVPAPLSTTGGGTEATALRVTLANDSTGLVSVDDNGTTLTVDSPTASLFKTEPAGNVAHDAADSGNPIKIGGIARQANPTAVTALDRADLYMDDLGRPCVRLYVPRDLVTQQTTTISASTAETTILTAVASTFLDVTSIIAINTSATALRIDIRDATAGTVRMALYLPAGDTRGFVFQVPAPQTAVNNNWTAQCSASVTDVRIFVQAVRDV